MISVVTLRKSDSQLDLACFVIGRHLTQVYRFLTQRLDFYRAVDRSVRSIVHVFEIEEQEAN